MCGLNGQPGASNVLNRQSSAARADGKEHGEGGTGGGGAGGQQNGAGGTSSSRQLGELAADELVSQVVVPGTSQGRCRCKCGHCCVWCAWMCVRVPACLWHSGYLARCVVVTLQRSVWHSPAVAAAYQRTAYITAVWHTLVMQFPALWFPLSRCDLLWAFLLRQSYLTRTIMFLLWGCPSLGRFVETLSPGDRAQSVHYYCWLRPGWGASMRQVVELINEHIQVRPGSQILDLFSSLWALTISCKDCFRGLIWSMIALCCGLAGVAASGRVVGAAAWRVALLRGLVVMRLCKGLNRPRRRARASESKPDHQKPPTPTTNIRNRHRPPATADHGAPTAARSGRRVAVALLPQPPQPPRPPGQPIIRREAVTHLCPSHSDCHRCRNDIKHTCYCPPTAPHGNIKGCSVSG